LFLFLLETEAPGKQYWSSFWFAGTRVDPPRNIIAKIPKGMMKKPLKVHLVLFIHSHPPGNPT
jgi:hypothetical protein